MPTFIIGGSRLLSKQIRWSRYLSGTTVRSFPEVVLEQEITPGTFRNFQDVISFRRRQAERSTLIGIKHENNIEKVLDVCESFGTINKKIVFKPGHASDYSLAFLVEYSSVNELKGLLSSCHHLQKKYCVPVFSRFLSFFSSSGKNSVKNLQASGRIEFQLEMVEAQLLDQLSSCRNTCQELETYYKSVSLSDLGSRLRFLFCTQVEDSLCGLLPHCQVFPFGSSVNGFGSRNCDLDVFVSLTFSKDLLQGPPHGLTFQPPSRQVSNDRTRTQLTLEVLGDLIENFFPCASNMQRILRARVPILKMHHTLMAIDCDISISNSTGFYMSELLFLLGELDSRVRPLVFAVRKWAKSMQLTKDVAGPWITNFNLTLLVLFFLQTRTPHILPTIQKLHDMADADDQLVVDGVDCTFKRSFNEIPKSENTEDIGSLLISFFRFIKETNWEENAISLVTGEIFKKPDNSAIFIQNPLEHHLNVSRNMSPLHVEKLVTCVSDSLPVLEHNYKHNERFQFFENRIDDGIKLKGSKGVNVHNLFKKSNQKNDFPNPSAVLTQNHANVRELNHFKNWSSMLQGLNDQVNTTKPHSPMKRKKISVKKFEQNTGKKMVPSDLWKLL